GKIEKIGNLDELKTIKGLHFYYFGLKEGDKVKKIKNSLDRYGDAVFVSDTRDELEKEIEKFNKIIENKIVIK
ncbi:MAG: hypothetical protein J6T53_06585, partial [Bacteroidales bacterium]|nr:hypothetical protein [Bacteroidales bacterium]